MAVKKPYVPTPPQLAEAASLLQTLQEIQDYLKSTQPRDEITHKSQRLTQKLQQKLQQSRQRVQQWGASEPNLFAKQPVSKPADTRQAAHIQVLTQELGPAKSAHPSAWISEGPEVQCLQQFLSFSGFELSDSGHFDAATQQALRQWQRQVKLPNSGLLDAKTRPVLNQHLLHWRQVQQACERFQTLLAEAREDWQQQLGHEMPVEMEKRLQHLQRQGASLLQHPPDTDFLAQLSAAEETEPWGYFQSCMSTPGLAHIVHQGPEVERLQSLLSHRGHPLKITGRFDLETFMALKQFQGAKGLEETGETDYLTLTQLNQWVLRENWYLQQRQRVRVFLLQYFEQSSLRASALNIAKGVNTALSFDALMAYLQPH